MILVTTALIAGTFSVQKVSATRSFINDPTLTFNLVHLVSFVQYAHLDIQDLKEYKGRLEHKEM
jgi:hypothetical protein